MIHSIESLSIPALNADVSRIGFGCCPMGMHEWGPTDETELIRAAHAALDNGIGLFDTADIYGLGVSETVLGKALKGRRHEAVIATKFGVRRENNRTFYDNSPGWIREAVDLSLSRLQTDYIDLYQVHYWDGQTSLEKTFGLLNDLIKDGKVLAVGVTNIDLLGAGFLEPIENLATFSYEYGLAKRLHEEQIVANHEKLGLCFLSWGSLGQGVLSGKYDYETILPENDRRRREVYCNFHGKKLATNLGIVNYLRQILPYYQGKTLPQLAIRWILDKFPFSIALTGIKREEQLINNAGALGWQMEPEHHARLCALSGGNAEYPASGPP